MRFEPDDLQHWLQEYDSSAHDVAYAVQPAANVH